MNKVKRLAITLSVLLVLVFTVGGIANAVLSNRNVGDSNEDGEFDVRDLIRMKRSLGINTLGDKLFYSNDFSSDIKSAPDPFILYDNGQFYLYYTETSGGVLQAYQSDNMKDWTSLGVIYQRAASYWGEGRFWAPKVVKNPADGKYYMYTSCSGSGTVGLPEGTSLDSSSDVYASEIKERLHLTVLVADSPKGPFKEWTGDRPNITTYQHGSKTGKGDTVTLTSGPMFDFANAPAGWETNEESFSSNGTNIFAQLDPYPFFDEDGTLYLYFVRSRDLNGTLQGVWGIKMLDMVTPDYETLTCLTEPGYYTVDDTDWGILDKLNPNKSDEVMDNSTVNEGCCVQMHTTVKSDGSTATKYYLTYSRSGAGCPYYSTCVAVANEPLGEFEKLKSEDGNPVHYIDATQSTENGSWSANANYDIFESTGNSMFFKVGDEEYLVSLCTEKVSGNKTRSFIIDRVVWQYDTSLGYDIPHSNGPTQGSLQPLPALITGYKNVASQATVTSNKSGDTALLNDGYITIHARDDAMVYYVDTGELCIELQLEEAKKLSSVLVYNAYDEAYAFASVDKIELIKNQSVVRTVTDVSFPDDYINAAGELRPGGAAIAVFAGTDADTVKIYISKALTDDATQIGISEIMLLGK